VGITEAVFKVKGQGQCHSEVRNISRATRHLCTSGRDFNETYNTIFITWVGIGEEVLKVRGRRSR